MSASRCSKEAVAARPVPLPIFLRLGPLLLPLLLPLLSLPFPLRAPKGRAFQRCTSPPAVLTDWRLSPPRPPQECCRDSALQLTTRALGAHLPWTVHGISVTKEGPRGSGEGVRAAGGGGRGGARGRRRGAAAGLPRSPAANTVIARLEVQDGPEAGGRTGTGSPKGCCLPALTTLRPCPPK